MEAFELIQPLTETALSEYISRGGIVLVDFYADWCQPCQRMLKILPSLAKEFEGRVQFVKINVDEMKTGTYFVTVIPTFHLYKDGKRIEEWTGIKTLLEMKRILDTHI